MPRRLDKRSMVSADRLLALMSAKDLDTLIESIFHVLPSVVRLDFVSAFYRSTSKGTLKERDSRGREYSPAFMRRYMELTPAVPLARANPGVRVLATRSSLPADDKLKKTAFYREIMQPQGWRHAVALCFWGDPPGEMPVFVTSVNRTDRRRDFSRADIARLERIHPFIDHALKRLHERDTARSMWDGVALSAHGEAFGLAVLDSNLSLVEANGLARRLCATWVDDGQRSSHSQRAWRLPPALKQTCLELRGEWQAQLQRNPDATFVRRSTGIPHPHLQGVTATVTIVYRSPTGLSEPSFIIELERVGKLDARAQVLQSLTAAERGVAMALIDGHSNQEIADQLAKSVDAVKFLLHRVYHKTGVASRAALVALLRA